MSGGVRLVQWPARAHREYAKVRISMAAQERDRRRRRKALSATDVRLRPGRATGDVGQGATMGEVER